MVGSTERCTFDKCDDGLRLFGTNGVIRLVGTESSSQSVIASFSVRSSSPGKTLKLWRASVIHLCRSICDSSCIVMLMLAGALKATSLGYKQRLHHDSTRQETFNLGVMCRPGYSVKDLYRVLGINWKIVNAVQGHHGRFPRSALVGNPSPSKNNYENLLRFINIGTI